MAFRCAVCKHPEVDTINLQMMEGVGNQAIAMEFGLTRTQVDHHRTSGHASRAITKAVIEAGQTGVLSAYAQIQIASKAERMLKLQTMVEKVELVIEERSKAFSHLPGGRSGLVGLKFRTIGQGKDSQVVEESFFDKELASEYRSILEQAAKEAGEWKPDGGDKADATRQLAQSIVIHAAVAAQSLEGTIEGLTIEGSAEPVE